MYRPLPPSVTISNSDIHGLGLFAATIIPGDVEIGISHIRDSRFEHGWIRTPLGAFYNHSEDPNCKKTVSFCGRFLYLIALREISAGEEITVKYTLYELSAPQATP
jgi:hypothetical protein